LSRVTAHFIVREVFNSAQTLSADGDMIRDAGRLELSYRPRSRDPDDADPPSVESLREGVMSGESLLIILVVGIIAGWLAGQIVQGTGFGIVGDLVLGVLGAFIGSWLLPQLGIHLGSGIVSAIINATIGALVLLFLIRLIRGGGGWGGRWGSGWGGGWSSRWRW
jgi:uncharacterized membrane protein YeaQ/YmgE (transglycosylase-associated protein family)